MTPLTVLQNAIVFAADAAAVIATPGSVELLLLTAAGCLPIDRRKLQQSCPPGSLNIAVVVPARNEELLVARCVSSLKAAARPWAPLEIVVVADNCTDRTAEVAEQAGAYVLRRNNLLEQGKGHALNFAFEQLGDAGYNAFLVVDADTTVSDDFLCHCAQAFLRGAAAVQCRYVVRNPDASPRTRLMSLALLAFNVLRPRGRSRLGLSCGIYGNGFGLTADVLRAVPFTASSVVEDLEYHLLLVEAGISVSFIDTATVAADMPTAGSGAATQRARWEGGRVRILRRHSFELLQSTFRGRVSAIEPLLDLILLPLGFHAILLLIACLSESWPARTAGLVGFSILGIHLIAAIAASNSPWIELLGLVHAPLYIGWKLLLIPKLIANSLAVSPWIRTDRLYSRRSDRG